MKNSAFILFLTIGCLLVFTVAQAQDSLKYINSRKDTSSINQCIIYITEWPEYPGGSVAMRQFIYEHLQYPKYALDNKIEGRVVLAFTVDTDGSLIDIRILKSVDKSVNEEAIRIVKLMPKWKPGKDYFGEKSLSKYKIDIIFNLPIKENSFTK
ncbi:MAG: energy transducer TonB [Cytophagaceae bacterium]|nr:energy transducer TonB [Cytophagaceae bacterium]